MKIGFFGGSFDPIHLGHISFIVDIVEKGILDKIFFCPANISPHKIENLPKASFSHRLKMVKMEISKYKNFDFLDLEGKREGVSYTIDTLKILKKQFPNDEIFLILSANCFLKFDSWKDYEKIIKNFSFIIGGKDEHFYKNIKTNLRPIFKKSFLKIRNMEISSSEIRERIKKNLYVSHLLSKEILDYICQNRLYF